MAERQVELVRQTIDAFNRRDWDTFARVMDDDVEVETRLATAEGGYRGQDGLRRWWDELLSVVPDYTLEVVELRDLGEFTLCHFDGAGHGAASNAPVVDPIWQPLQWRGERCVWWRVCSSEDEALEAIRTRT